MKEKNGFHYQKIYEDLKKSIIDGSISPGELLPPENTVAQQYEVDRSTVRKALQLLVDEEYVIKRPGKGSIVIWDPNKATGSKVFTSKGSQNVGFLLPSGNAITQPFYSTLFYVVEKELKRFSYTLIYSTFDEGDDLLSLVEKNSLCAIIFVSNISEHQITIALEHNIPCALVNSFDPRVPSILSDNETGAYLAGKHLLENGHRNVLVISGARNYFCGSERKSGFVKAYNEAGISLPDSAFLYGDSWEQESSISVVRNHLKSCSSLPSAIFAFNDRLAFGVMLALRQCGLRVPEDVSVMGYDNLNVQSSVIALTTIEAHVEYVAEYTAAAILWQLAGGSRNPYRINIPTELVIGETVRKI